MISCLLWYSSSSSLLWSQVTREHQVTAPNSISIRQPTMLAVEALPPVNPSVVPQPLMPIFYSLTQHQAPLPDPPQETVPSPAPAPGAMNLADLENIALRNNPSLAESAARVNALRGKWEQVGLPPNPYAGYSSQQTGSGNTVEQRGVVFGQELIMGHKLQLNRAVVGQEVQRAEQLFAAQRMRVITDVRITYFEVLIAQRRVMLAQQISEVASNMVTITQRRLDAKEVGKTDLLQGKIEYESARVLKQRAENQYVEAWRKLAAIVGVPTLAPQPLAGIVDADIPRYEWESSLQRLLSTSPEISAAQAEIQRTRWAYQRAQAEKKSNLSFQGIVQDDRSIDAVNGAVQVTLPIPLWNRNQGGITQAGHEALVAERSLQKLELDLQQRLAVVFQRYDSARIQVERYAQEILPNAQENLGLVQKAYQAGEFDYLQFLLAQRTFSQTNLEYLNSIAELRTVALEIEGLLLSNSLQATSGQ
ncbi:MAG: TolC family protein [Pirellulales bacterium]|nr:TolC family protein [Pirellulales bacterium]